MSAQTVWFEGDTERVTAIYVDGQSVVSSATGAITAADITLLLNRLGPPDNVYTYGASKLGFWLLYSIATDAGEKAMANTIATIALASRDIMVDFVATHGYYVSLRSFTGDVPPTDGLAALVSSFGTFGYLDRTTMAGKITRWLLAECDNHYCNIRTTTESLRQWQQTPPNTRWMTGSPPSLRDDLGWLCTRLESA